MEPADMPKDSLACLEALPPPLLRLIAARVPSHARLALAGVSTRLRRALAGDMACELWTKPELSECVSPSLLRAVATTAGSRGRGLVELSVPIPRGFDPQQALLEELFVCVAAQPNATTLRRVCLVQPSDSADNEDEERLLVDGEDVLKLLSLVSPTCVVVVDGVLTTSPEEEALSLLRAAPRLSVRHLHIEGWCTSLPPAPAVDAAPVLALAASVASTSLESLSLFGAPLNFPASLRALLHALATLPAFTSLDLYDESLSSAANLRSLTTFLEAARPRLRRLCLSSPHAARPLFTGADSLEFGDSLGGSRITHLALEDVGLWSAPMPATALLASLERHPSLQHLSLARNAAGGHPGLEAVEVKVHGMIRGLMSSSSGDAGAAADPVRSVMERFDRLAAAPVDQAAVARKNAPRIAAGAALSRLLSAPTAPPRLEVFDVCGCALCDIGLRPMMEALSSGGAAALRTLYIADNHASDVFLRDVAIPAAAKLARLDVRNQ